MGIAGLIINYEPARAIVFTKLEPEHFFSDEARKIFVTVRGLWIKEKDVVIGDVMEKSGVSATRISEYTDSIPTTANLEWNIERILECADRRRLIKHASDIMDVSYSSKIWSDGHALAMGSVFSMAKGDDRGEEVLTGEGLANKAFKRIDEAHKNPLKMVGPATGFPTLDRLVLGLEKPLILLSGAPGQGKSALAANIAVNTAVGGTKTLIITLENTQEQTTNRVVSILSGVPVNAIRTGIYASENEYALVLRALAELRDLPLIISDERPRGIEEVSSLIIREKIIHNIDFAIVDYLGEISQRRMRDESRWEMLGRYTQTLKEVSQNPKVNIPIMLVNQLRRGTLTQSDVTMDDEGGSYLIPQKVQLSLSMRRVKPEKGEENTWPRKYLLKVNKSRHAPDYVEIPLNFWGATMKFEEAK